LFCFVFATAVANGCGEGLEAKNTAKTTESREDLLSVAMSRMSIGGSKKTEFTMYKTPGSVKSSKTMKTTANFSFAGKSFANDGTVIGSAEYNDVKPVMSVTIEKAIAAGLLCFAQVDHWDDDELNKRASVHLMMNSGICFEALSCRKSSTD